MTLPRILIGAECVHAPTGDLVLVVDHELAHRPRPLHESARTGNFIVRVIRSHVSKVVRPEDLQTLR